MADRAVPVGTTVASVLAIANPGDRLLVEGDHTAEGRVTCETNEITFEDGDGNALMEGIKFGNAHLLRVDGGAVKGINFLATTGWTSTRTGVEVDNGTGIELEDFVVTGHGYARGVWVSERYESTYCSVNRVTVHDIENYGIYVVGNNHTVTNCEVYGLFRGVGNTQDVDCIRWAGNDCVFIGNVLHDMDAADSDGDPHVDGFQTFTHQTSANAPSGLINIETKRTRIENNIIFNVNDQCLIAENNNTTTQLIDGLIFRGNQCYGSIDNQLVNSKGVANLVVEGNTFHIKSGAFRAVYFDAGGGGGVATSLDPIIRRNVLFRSQTSQELYTDGGGRISGTLTEENNLMVDLQADDAAMESTPTFTLPENAVSQAALTPQKFTHATSGAVVINMAAGHVAEITLDANITAHSFSNLEDGQVLAVYYQANGGSRQINFSGLTTVPGFTNPGNVTLTAGQMWRATIIRQFGTTRLLDAEQA